MVTPGFWNVFILVVVAGQLKKAVGVLHHNRHGRVSSGKDIQHLTNGCTVTPKEYNINLDDDPHHRWDQVLNDFPMTQEDTVAAITLLLQEMGLSPKMLPYLTKIAKFIHKELPQPYRDEIQGIAGKTNTDVGLVTMLNIGYDLSAFCTSIVATDANGDIWHARNLDYNSTSQLRNTTITVNFQRNGKTLFSGVTFAGYIGLVTAIKPNAFTMSIDERDVGAFIDNILELLDPKVSLLGFDLRELMDKANSYSEAVAFVSSLHMPAPVYVILGGLKGDEGTVVTRSRRSAIDIWPLSTAKGRWYLVETNYDHWNNPPWWDDRRTPAEQSMNATGQNAIGKMTMFNVLSTPKVFNQYTVYTTVMSASRPNETQTWIRC
ncbi:N-acylethanolamine-hydrolyzing acid amidase-like [Paramacrobiotus metropolitanus]|uniref:N-acylethanolamine-hydrolyzing acid amidase-like n=1 Tax=Paramacrobiotus metropolitanus TaxID=2943436 RepID=UPI002446423F|nr:N-acylethanolamine-hydrolyzing acid amidase-like [Paramacrobiotus metropolitanus]